MRRPLILIPILALSLLLTALPTMAVSGSQGQREGAGNQDFDRAFLHEMVMHHMMAVMMAQPVAAGATHEEVRRLATDVISGQSAEIARMQAWLTDWYGMSLTMPGMPVMDGMPGAQMPGPGARPETEMMHDMPGMQPGMEMMPGMHMSGMQPMPSAQMTPETRTLSMEMMAGMMDMMGLNRLSGERLESVFMLLMIPHHENAISMAEEAVERATHEEVRQLARQIIAAQSAEIDQMNGWLAAWYGL